MRKPSVMFVMLNPSKAAEHADDPTIVRCINYAGLWGYGGIRVGNLFALRSTDPDGLLWHEDPIGPENDAYLKSTAAKSDLVLVAWGSFASRFPNREKAVKAMLLGRMHCLGTTKDGKYPLHPVRQKKDLTPRRFFG